MTHCTCGAEMVPTDGGEYCARCYWDAPETTEAAPTGSDCDACEYMDIDDGAVRCRARRCIMGGDDE